MEFLIFIFTLVEGETDLITIDESAIIELNVAWKKKSILG